LRRRGLKQKKLKAMHTHTRGHDIRTDRRKFFCLKNISHRKWLGTNSRKAIIEIMKLLRLKAILDSFSPPVRKLFIIPEPYEQILKRTTQGTFLQQISLLDIIF
jgi:hypothetical protein